MPYKNPEDRKKYSAQYRIKNKDKIDAYRNKQENKDRKLAWKRENRDWLNQYKRERKIKLGKFVEGVIDKCRVCGKEFSKKGPNNKYCSKKCQWKSKNKYPDGQRPKKSPEELKIARLIAVRKYDKKRRKIDLKYRITKHLRTRLANTVRKQGTKKKARTEKLLGCSWEVFVNYIEKKFQPGMTWDNYGKWHLDHIKPMSKFNLVLKEEQLKCCNYKNLQPLWAKDNISKSDKY
jgi:hypothetical protein